MPLLRPVPDRGADGRPTLAAVIERIRRRWRLRLLLDGLLWTLALALVVVIGAAWLVNRQWHPACAACSGLLIRQREMERHRCRNCAAWLT